MTRLFLRFYLGVLLILFTAWCVQGYVASRQPADVNVRVVEHAMSGGQRAVKHRLDNADDFAREFAIVEKISDYPVTLVDPDQFEDEDVDRLEVPDELIYYREGQGGYTAIRLENTGLILVSGPLPEFVGPSQFYVVSGYGTILISAAAGIALLLRPVARQLHQVERTAMAIAGGDFSARVDTRKVPRGRRLVRAFNTMADHTERLLQTQRNLLQSVSHELRTPLSRMRFAINLIASAESDEERQVRLDSLEGDAEELNELVGELLSYAKSESLTSRGAREVIKLAPMISRLTSKLTDYHQHLSIDFSQITDESFELRAEPKGLERVLSNVTNNACKYATSSVEIKATRLNDSYVAIDVLDDGGGIPVSDRQRVLDPFVRLEGAPDETAKTEGVGLGLAIVNRIVSAQGGSIEISETPGGFTRIRTLWPQTLP